MSQQKVINVARGLEKAELVIKNANIVKYKWGLKYVRQIKRFRI